MNRRLGSCLLGFVLVTALASVGALGGVADAQAAASPQPQSTPEEFDGTLFRLTVYENGSARWTVQHSRPLNDSEKADFERFAEEFRQTETQTYTDFRNRSRNLVAFGEDATGRPMNATAFSRDAYVRELGQTRGSIEMSFRWTNFARTEGDRVVVSDVFEGGMYVGPDQRLRIERGPSLAFTNATPSPDSMTVRGDLAASESITWVGEARFLDQRPSVTFLPRGSAGGKLTTAAAGDGAASGGDGAAGDGQGTPARGDAGGMMPVLLAGGLVVLILAGGLALYGGYVPSGRGGILDRQSGDDGASGSTDIDAGGGGGAGAAPTAGAAEVSEEDLLSDEDRVLHLLDENDGRMKQVAIVEETEWSKSKVSMLLSDMEDEGQISKLRLGRENIISLAGQEPEAAGSPFEDE